MISLTDLLILFIFLFAKCFPTIENKKMLKQKPAKMPPKNVLIQQPAAVTKASRKRLIKFIFVIQFF